MESAFDQLITLVGHDGANRRLSEISDIRDSAIRDLIRSAYRRKARQEIETGQITHSLLKLAVADIGQEYFKSDSKAGRKSMSPMKFITINAKDGIDPQAFVAQMKKCVKKQKLQAKRGIYVLEQRSEGTQDPYGWHIHWLVEFESTTSLAVVTQQTYQCFQKYLAGSNYVDVREIYNEEQWTQKQSYMQGNKKDEKMSKVEKDRVVRDQLNIPHHISY